MAEYGNKSSFYEQLAGFHAIFQHFSNEPK